MEDRIFSPKSLQKRPTGTGYFYVALAALLWAASGSTAKFLFREGILPLQLVQLRTTIALTSLFAWLLIRDRTLLKIAPKDLLYFPLTGIALAVTQGAYLYSISKIQVAAAILLQYQSPVLIAAYAYLFTRKRPSFTSIVAITGALAGCYLMVGGYSLDMVNMNASGIAAGLVSAVAFAAYTVISEQGMKVYRPWTVLFYALVFAAVFWNTFQPPLSAFSRTYSSACWLGVLFVSTFGMVIPYGLYNKGISVIQATNASITATLEPVIAGIIAYLFLGEFMHFWQLAGGMLVISSIVFLQTRQGHRNPHKDIPNSP